MDNNKIGRIDTLELFAVILLSIDGRFEVLLMSKFKCLTPVLDVMLIFGFGDETEFSRDEFHYFLDCLFRGICKLALPKGHKKPL